MSKLDDLIDQIPDRALRKQLTEAVRDLRGRKRFGLVFEEHIPETGIVYGASVQVGATVLIRTDPGAQQYRVLSVNRGRAHLEPTDRGSGTTRECRVRDLLVVRAFGEAIFPTLKGVGSVRRGGSDRPSHAVINGENYHALELLTHVCAGQVDCIYIDPPYNTGATDWRYNNRYVDSKDSYRHSRWLSFIDKRIRLARQLLKPDGVLVVTVDEHELHHLGMLVERVFPDPDYYRYTVTIVTNPKGTYKANFGRVDEQAIFVVPNVGYDLINPRPAGEIEGATEEDGTATLLIRRLAEMADVGLSELLADDAALDANARELLVSSLGEAEEPELDLVDAPVEDAAAGGTEDAPPEGVYEDLFLRRRGQESSHREQRPNQFYAILVDEKERRVVGIGPALSPSEKYEVAKKKNVLTVYPIASNRGVPEERVWRYTRKTMKTYIDAGAIVVGKHDPSLPQPYTLNHRRLRKDVRRLKTVWWSKAHDAGTHGTNVLNAFLGKRNLFPFPKSIYAVQDSLAAVVRDRPDALIVDFFAGSGTTFHSTCLLNAQDGGRRRTILVTNNEVAEKTAADLHQRGFWRTDAEFERHGIFEAVTRPRCTAVVTGKLPNGKSVPGKHRTGRPFSQGFEENIEFLRLDYLDQDLVELGEAFTALEPIWWLGAGATGAHAGSGNRSGFAFPKGARYGVLFEEGRFKAFLEELRVQPHVEHALLATESPEAYAEMCERLPDRVRGSMLYGDYLRFFRRKARGR